MTERQKWSHSKLQRLMKCGEAYRREEIDKEQAPPTSTMVRGTALHYVAASSHMRQMTARQEHKSAPRSLILRTSLPTEEEAADLAATKFEAERSTTGIAAPSDERDAPSKVIGRDKDAAVKMSRFYVTSVAPYVDPIAVERKVVVEPADSNIRLSGIIDLVSAEPAEIPGVADVETVRDLKSKSRKPYENEAVDSDQLTMYALLRKLETGQLPHYVALDHVIQEPGMFKAPYRITQRDVRTEADLGVMVSRLNNAIDSVKAGVFLANGVGQWWCSAKWCRFHSTCPFVRKR